VGFPEKGSPHFFKNPPAARGEVRAHRKVELAARAGDVLDARGLGIHLTEQIAVDGRC